MVTISIPLINAYASRLASLIGPNVMFRLCSSPMFIQNSLHNVSPTEASAVTEALKSLRSVKPPALTEKKAVERSKSEPYKIGWKYKRMNFWPAVRLNL
ncbi:hypothetical protein ACFX1X_024053 [Malus domestica]